MEYNSVLLLLPKLYYEQYIMVFPYQCIYIYLIMFNGYIVVYLRMDYDYCIPSPNSSHFIFSPKF